MLVVTEGQTEGQTMSPIELLWTAKNKREKKEYSVDKIGPRFDKSCAQIEFHLPDLISQMICSKILSQNIDLKNIWDKLEILDYYTYDILAIAVFRRK